MTTSIYSSVISPYESELMRYPDVPEDCKKHLDNYVSCDRLPNELLPGSHWLDRPKWFYGIGATSIPDTPFIKYAVKHPELRLLDRFPIGEVVPGIPGKVLISQTVMRVFKHAFREIGIRAPPPQLCFDETQCKVVVVAQLFNNYSTSWKEDDQTIVECAKEIKDFFGLGEEWQPRWYRRFPMYEDPLDFQSWNRCIG